MATSDPGAAAATRSMVLVAMLAPLAGCLGTPTPTGSGLLDPGFASMGALDDDCLALVGGVNLQSATVADLQAAMAAGAVTSVDLVDAYLARIVAYDDAATGANLNSVRLVNPAARSVAAALDAERAAGTVRGPLHGVPVLLKDNVGTNDMPTTAGSIALADNVPAEDATLTARLRDAGAVVLGKANLDEFANWMSPNKPQGYSSLGGQVRNAHHYGNPSSSSSGSGVAASMALAAATVGTETSGSILGPSEANGVVGVKPTVGLVSRAGVIPLAASFDTPGPMARNVHDAAAMLGALAGPDPRDPATATSGTAVPAGNDYVASLSADALGGARLGYDPRDAAWEDPIFAAARGDLERAGATLVAFEWHPDLDLLGIPEYALIPNEFKFGLNAYLATEAGPGLPVRTLADIIAFNDRHPDRVRYGQEYLVASDATPGNGALAQAAALPVVGANAAAAGSLFERDRLDAIVTPGLGFRILGAAAGFPTVIVPAGYDGDRPRGLSFFGDAWSEERLLAFAYAYEQESQRRVPPTSVNADLVAQACGAGTDADGPESSAETATRSGAAFAAPVRVPAQWT